MDRGALILEPVSSAEDPLSPSPGTFVPRHSRRLSDKLLVAFHHACDVTDLEVADQLLRLLELMTTRRPRPEDGNRRRSIEGLVAAHERLWHLRHPQTE